MYLTALATAPLTYPESGATRGPLPPGYHHLTRRRVLGHGAPAFEGAVTGLFGWEVHRRAGLSITASSPTAATGCVVWQGIGLGPLRIGAPCRVVYVVDEPDRRGFAYGTLPGHPECGEEAFLVGRDADGTVWGEVRAFSRPASPLTRLAGPAGRLVQRIAVRRYLGAMARAASSVDGSGSVG
jgi:uncharacterized protein (UPF0548 family)